ncbi:hypothetical protein K501DRAFT_178330, partial [Backusella circina FSU 941]
PHLQENFFLRPLPEEERKKFLFNYPKNTLREYDPSRLPKVSLSTQVKHHDSHLIDIQYQLSGITKPIDWCNHEMLQPKSLEFVISVHELLSDLASHASQVRTYRMFVGHFSTVDSASSSNLLLDPYYDT